jgi:autotransporter-associated beta strand protein
MITTTPRATAGGRRALRAQVLTTALALAAAIHARAAVDFVCWWGNNYSGLWSDINPENTSGKVAGWWDQNGDGIADVADDPDLADGTNVVARFSSMTGRTITLDSDRTVSRLWHNWDGSSGATCSGSIAIGASGDSVLTLAREGGTPEIHIGYRFTSGNYDIGMTVNAPLAGTQGFTVGCPTTDSYGGYGLVLGGTNTIGGTISGFRLLTLRNEFAAQNASISIAGAYKLRLRHDTDGATFRTAGIVVNSTTSSGATIDVDRAGAGGETNHLLVLEGPIAVSGKESGNKTLTVKGGNGYRLELTGCYTNTFAGAAGRIDADSANVALSGAAHNLGGGLILGGTMTTGVNTISGAITGAGGIAKDGVSCWALDGANTYAGATVVDDGALLVNGTHAGGGAYTVNAGGTLGGTGSIRADVAVSTNAVLAPGSLDDAGATIGTMAIGSGDAPAEVSVADGGILAIDYDGADADLVSVAGSVTLGNVTIETTARGASSVGAYKILAANGGIALAGNLTLAGSEEIVGCVLRNGGTELWLNTVHGSGSLITIR